jgi:hypothetical protein
MIESALAALPAASSELLSRRELLRRTDTKFVVDRSALERLIDELADEYAVLRAGDQSIATYKNLYFDTADLQCFHDHRRGRRIRRKVRIRHYPDRSLSFLEVKIKRGDLVTDKRRRQIDYGTEALDGDQLAFLTKHAPALDLAPALRIDYRRIAVVHLHEEERLTIDLDLVAEYEGRRNAFEGAVIVELKRPPHSRASTPALRALARFRASAFSKYCAAMIRLRPEVRHNRLLPTLRGISAIGVMP